MTKPATHPTQVFVNGRAFAWTPETGLDPAAVSALDDYLWREANRTARAFRRLGVEADDLYQEAYLHCLGAARRYDPTRGANFLTFASYAYEDLHLLMPLYVCRRWEGMVQSREGQALKWVRARNLRDYPMPPADEPLLPALVDLIG